MRQMRAFPAPVCAAQFTGSISGGAVRPGVGQSVGVDEVALVTARGKVCSGGLAGH